MRVLSVICARSGSKGLKNKCIEKIGKKMVIEYAIEYSLSLGNDVKSVVSTDIGKVIDLCKTTNVDFIDRKPELCKDDSRIDDALADAIETHGAECEYCSLVFGNIPTRYPRIFRQAYNFLLNNLDYDMAISMQNVEKYNPEWMFEYREDILPLKQALHYRRQMLPQKMIHDGHTMIFRADKFLKKYKGIISYNKAILYSVFGDKVKPVINNEIIVDIDTIKDIKIARSIFNGALS